MSGLFFLLCAMLCNISPRGIRNITALTLGGVLACAATWTFIYNNLNRQVMAANQQKWEAFQELVSYISIERTDLKTHPFYAPSLWTLSGVSAIPDPSPFMSGNYWTTYSKVMMGVPLTILDGKTDAPADAVFASYFATPRNIPVAVLYVRPTEQEAGTLTLVTPSRLDGSISYRFADGMAMSRELNNWKCREYCVAQWQEMRLIQPDSISVTPSDSGPKRLLVQFFLPRSGAFGEPLAGVR